MDPAIIDNFSINDHQPQPPPQSNTIQPPPQNKPSPPQNKPSPPQIKPSPQEKQKTPKSKKNKSIINIYI